MTHRAKLRSPAEVPESDGRPIRAAEPSHDLAPDQRLVLRWQELAGNAAVTQRLLADAREPVAPPLAARKLGAPSAVQREVVYNAAHAKVSFRFRIGIELDPAFASLAKNLAARGTIGQNDLRKLRDHALKLRDTVNDNERMFMAGLLDPANVAILRGAAGNPPAAIRFRWATLSLARLRQVIDLDRKPLPSSVTEPARRSVAAARGLRIVESVKELEQANRAARGEIAVNAAPFRAQARSLITYSDGNGVSPALVLRAMLTAASDNSASDRLMAGVVYAVAAVAGHPMRDDVLAGRVKVDALSAAAMAALPQGAGLEAAYVPVAQATGLKGDTLYVSSATDIDNLANRSIIIHELQHAHQDKSGAAAAAASLGGISFESRAAHELAAYRVQARYILDQIVSLAPARSASSAAQVASSLNGMVGGAILLEGQRDRSRYDRALRLLFGAARPPVPANQVTALLASQPAALETRVLGMINSAYRGQPAQVGLEGLSGESLIK